MRKQPRKNLDIEPFVSGGGTGAADSAPELVAFVQAQADHVEIKIGFVMDAGPEMERGIFVQLADVYVEYYDGEVKMYAWNNLDIWNDPTVELDLLEDPRAAIEAALQQIEEE